MKYILGFVLTIFLIIFTLFLIFRGGDDTATDAPNAPARLVDYANTTTEVQLTVDFPINADQVHRQDVTRIGRDQATFTAYEGYEGRVLRTQSYANNATAYANFLRALQLVGYGDGRNDPNLRDERGYCPDGSRYIMEIIDGTNVIQRYWSTSCGNIGSFKGQSNSVINLFKKQIPDYNKLTSDTTYFL